jgi:ankyrin repeat protein
MQINKYQEYKGKYLKYKKKYLDLQQYLLKMNGGTNCPVIGFHQHMGECWHDGLSTILLYSYGIGENAQKIFDAPNEDKSDLIINGQKISELDIDILGDKIPQDLLPINFDLDNPDDKNKLIRFAKDYISNLYSRYSNDKKPRESKLKLELPLVLPHFTRQDSIESSLFCVENIFGISNHNNHNLKIYSDERGTHGGGDIQVITTLNMFSYFLLNDPEAENKYYLYLHKIELNDIFNKSKSKEEVLRIITRIKNNIGEADCIYIISKSQKKNKYREEEYKEYEQQLILDQPTSLHVQCFFKCDGDGEDNEKYYDDNGVHRYKNKDKDTHRVRTQDDKDKLIIPFKWKQYLTEIIDEIIKSDFKKEDIPKFYCKFSKMYFDEKYGIKYHKRNISRISSFILIKKEKYTPESYKKYLITLLPIYMKHFKNKRFLKIFESSTHNQDIQEYFTTQSQDGSTVLINEIYINEIDKIKFLLSIPGIEKCFTIKNNLGYTPLMLAIENYKIDILKLLLNTPGIEESLIVKNNDDYTPLMLAIFNNKENIVELLLKIRGIEKSFTVQNNEGFTPLMLAINNQYENIVGLLLKAPGIEQSLTLQNNNSFTPLMIAIRRRNENIVELLLKTPGIEKSMKLQNKRSYTLLMTAIEYDKEKIVEKLLQKPEIIESLPLQNNDGDTAIMLAIRNENINIVKLLLKIPEIEKSMTLKNKKGETSSTLALKSNNQNIKDLF